MIRSVESALIPGLITMAVDDTESHSAPSSRICGRLVRRVRSLVIRGKGASYRRQTKAGVMADATKDAAPYRPSLWRRIRSIHPAFVLAALDLIGLGIASYLSIVELTPGGAPVCTLGGLHIGNCEDVAKSVYSRPFAGIPVAVYGVILSITLFTLAVMWWR